MRFYDDLLKDKIVVINLMYADCEGVSHDHVEPGEGPKPPA